MHELCTDPSTRSRVPEPSRSSMCRLVSDRDRDGGAVYATREPVGSTAGMKQVFGGQQDASPTALGIHPPQAVPTGGGVDSGHEEPRAVRGGPTTPRMSCHPDAICRRTGLAPCSTPVDTLDASQATTARATEDGAVTATATASPRRPQRFAAAQITVIANSERTRGGHETPLHPSPSTGQARLRPCRYPRPGRCR